LDIVAGAACAGVGVSAMSGGATGGIAIATGMATEAVSVVERETAGSQSSLDATSKTVLLDA
jgi:hypothetical protein